MSYSHILIILYNTNDIHYMKLKPLFLLLILSASAVIILSGQELMVVDFKDAPHDVSARENQASIGSGYLQAQAS
jgi:hypothetical protein